MDLTASVFGKGTGSFEGMHGRALIGRRRWNGVSAWVSLAAQMSSAVKSVLVDMLTGGCPRVAACFERGHLVATSSMTTSAPEWDAVSG